MRSPYYPRRHGRATPLAAIIIALFVVPLVGPSANASAKASAAGMADPRNVHTPSAGRAAAIASPFPEYADISNGTIRLGVNPQGNIDVDTPTGSLGLEFVPTGGDALIPGCYCEGWGVADRGSGVSGYASVDNGGVSGNLTVLDFDVTETTATSVVQIGDGLRVTHEYRPSTSPNLYQVVSRSAARPVFRPTRSSRR